MKKKLALFLSMFMIFNIFSLTVTAKQKSDVTDEQKKIVALKTIDEYNKLYKKFNGDIDKVMNELTSTSKNLKLVSNIKTTYKIDSNGNAVLYEVYENGKQSYKLSESNTESEIVKISSTPMSDLDFDDNIV